AEKVQSAEPEQTTSNEDTESKSTEVTASEAPSSTEAAATESAEVPTTKADDGESQNAEDSNTVESTEEEAEPTFKISNFLEKVHQATPIEDIFSVKYPADIVAVDSSKQIPGKKYRYDPQFLIQFRDILQFPMDPEFKAQLEKVDIQTAKKGSNSGQRSMSKFGNGLPGRFNGQPGRGPQFNDPRQNSRSGSKRRGGGSGSSRDKSTRKSNQSKRGGREREEDKGITIAPEDIKPLEKTDNRWVPRSRAKKTEVRYAEDGSVILEDEDVERKVKSLLNKLTLEMFTQISDDVIAIANQSKWEKDSKTIRSVISLTFAKACDEPYWSEMYAKFCAKLCTNVPTEVTDETITLPDGSHPSGGSLARRILLTTCQTEYEKGWTDKLPTNEDGSPLEPEMMSDEYYVMAAAKRRGLGLVKFIGHLYNLGMLNDQVIFVCLRDQCKNVVDPSEDSLENLAQLVKTVGPKLDTDERKKAILKIVFENIQKILDNVKLSSRIMFMLMDLQDLRKQRWISDKSEAGPKTIEEIHRDAEIKRMEELKASNEKKQQRRYEGRSNSSRSASSAGGAGGSGYLSNLKKSPSFATQNNQFTNASNSKNDSELNRESSKRSESTQVNRFAALGADDENNE
ncbi:ARM repeat-containing protein, partial [Suhomyces tanzawaensis NRRL Y-17324]